MKLDLWGWNPLVLLGNLGHRWSGTIYHQPSAIVQHKCLKTRRIHKSPIKRECFWSEKKPTWHSICVFSLYFDTYLYWKDTSFQKNQRKNAKKKWPNIFKVWIHLCILSSLTPFPKTGWKGGVTFQQASPDRWPASRVEQGLPRKSGWSGNSKMCYFQSYLEEWSNLTFSNGLKPPN